MSHLSDASLELIFLKGNLIIYDSIKEGERHYLATTQFQHSSCRKAFPSFDDPGLKQTFSFDCEYLSWFELRWWSKLTLDITKKWSQYLVTFKYPEYSALFNIFENEKSYDDATQTHSISFGPTMKMSPYLLAFVISDYQIDSAQG